MKTIELKGDETEITISDKIDYKNILPGKYTVSATLHKEDGSDTGITFGKGTLDLSDKKGYQKGSTTVALKFNPKDILQDTNPVSVTVYEQLLDADTGALVAEHSVKGDEKQTVTIVPKKVVTVSTFASVGSDKTITAGTGEFTITEKVCYAGLDKGTEYTWKAGVVNAEGQKFPSEIVGNKEFSFTPEAAEGCAAFDIKMNSNEFKEATHKNSLVLTG
jgi:hypothetical protein